ncbi:hypothetical protein ACHAP8_010453 [Fusarium lateritium]
MSHWRWIYIGAMVFLIIWNISVILVFFLICIPMTAIWNPAVKGSSIALAIVRIRWANVWSTSTWDIVRPQLWGLAEITSALICACVPSFKPLLVRLNAMRPRCQKTDHTGAVRHQRSDDEMELNMDTMTMVASQSQDRYDEDPQRTLRAQSYGTNTYIEAKPHPWRK